MSTSWTEHHSMNGATPAGERVKGSAPALSFDEFACTPLCLPQFDLHSIPCQAQKRMDPLHPERPLPREGN